MSHSTTRTRKETYNFKRPCVRCDNLFRPDGKGGRVCPDCTLRPSGKTALMKRYFKQKEQLDIIRSNATLEKWKVLSKAYKIGKNIWGSKFTRQRLAFDMDMPVTTVLRCLSLDKANKKTWKLIKQGRISTFKVAQICQSKNVVYQDEIVNMVMEENLSTYQISSIKISKFDDINKERHRLAIEKGYSRQSSAADSFQKWIERGKLFLLMKKSALTETKYEAIRKDLITLNKKIALYVS